MSMPRKRPLEDPNQYYAYVWRYKNRVIWVGAGKNNRGRPDCKSSWSGRPKALVDLLERHRHRIKVEVFPCTSQQEARELEERLIAELNPKYNTAPHYGGWKGMHTPEGLANIAKVQKERVQSLEERKAKSRRMKGNKNLLGHKHSEETKAKISQSNKGRKPSALCRQKSSERATERNKTNPPRKGKKCPAEHRRKLSEARKRWGKRKRKEQTNASKS